MGQTVGHLKRRVDPPGHRKTLNSDDQRHDVTWGELPCHLQWNTLFSVLCPSRASSTKACKFRLSFPCHPLPWVQEEETPPRVDPSHLQALPLRSQGALQSHPLHALLPGVLFLLAPCCPLIWSRKLCQASRSPTSGPTQLTSGPAASTLSILKFIPAYDRLYAACPPPPPPT